MKYSIIEDLYHGGRGSYENIKQSEEYKRLSAELAKKEEELDKGLNEQQKELYKEIDYLQMGVECEAALTYYKEGFKTGILLAMEAFLVD